MSKTQARWTKRPPGSNWGDFGTDDQKGRLNLITSVKVLQGIAEVKCGISFCLTLPLDFPGGDYHGLKRLPPDLRAVHRGGGYAYNFRPRSHQSDVWSDDVVTLYTQASTQWDALSHVGSAFDADGDGCDEICFYNGFRAGEHLPAPVAGGAYPGKVGALALGIENMAATCVQGRGVMIDLHRHYGAAQVQVGYDDLMRICEADRVEVEVGDMVCLHTGLAGALLTMDRQPDTSTLEQSHSALDGRDDRLLNWITDSGLAVLIADNFAVESVPSRDDATSAVSEPLHELCIFKLGIHLGELWYLSELAAWLKHHQRTRFLLTAPPLRLPGAVGSPVTPVATV
ncbi:MAG: cyclase family protein [Variovorax sp.]